MRRMLLGIAIAALGCCIAPSGSWAEVLVRPLHLGRKVSQKRGPKAALHIFLLHVRKKGIYRIEATKAPKAECVLYRRSGRLVLHHHSDSGATCRILYPLSIGKYSFQLSLAGGQKRGRYQLTYRKAKRSDLRKYAASFQRTFNRMRRDHGKYVDLWAQGPRMKRKRRRYERGYRRFLALKFTRDITESIQNRSEALQKKRIPRRLTGKIKSIKLGRPHRFRLRSYKAFQSYSVNIPKAGLYQIKSQPDDLWYFLFQNRKPVLKLYSTIHLAPHAFSGNGVLYLPRGTFQFKLMHGKGSFTFSIGKHKAKRARVGRLYSGTLKPSGARYFFATRIKKPGVYQLRISTRAKRLREISCTLYRFTDKGPIDHTRDLDRPLRCTITRYLDAGLYHMSLFTFGGLYPHGQISGSYRLQMKSLSYLVVPQKSWECRSGKGCCKVIARAQSHDLRCTHLPRSLGKIMLFVDNRYRPRFRVIRTGGYRRSRKGRRRRGAHYVLRDLYRKKRPKRLLFLLPGHRRMSVPLARLFRRRKTRASLEFSLSWKALHWNTPWPKSRPAQRTKKPRRCPSPTRCRTRRSMELCTGGRYSRRIPCSQGQTCRKKRCGWWLYGRRIPERVFPKVMAFRTRTQSFSPAMLGMPASRKSATCTARLQRVRVVALKAKSQRFFAAIYRLHVPRACQGSLTQGYRFISLLLGRKRGKRAAWIKTDPAAPTSKALLAHVRSAPRHASYLVGRTIQRGISTQEHFQRRRGKHRIYCYKESIRDGESPEELCFSFSLGLTSIHNGEDESGMGGSTSLRMTRVFSKKK